ncbi:MAG: molecular chaperone [Rhodocyclaceae bacterium]
MILRKALAALLATCLAYVTPASAGVVMYGTRVVYDESNRTVSICLANKDNAPNLMQVWVDRGEGRPPEEADAVPFVITPPLFRLAPQGQQNVRIAFDVAAGASLPRDRESLFWFNFLQVPPKDSKVPQAQALMQMAFHQQVKLFYRPAGLQGDPAQVPDALRFAIEPATNKKGKWHIVVTNPTAYHANFSGRVALISDGAESEVDMGDQLTVAPFASVLWPVSPSHAPVAGEIAFSLIGDRGNLMAGRAVVEVRQ